MDPRDHDTPASLFGPDVVGDARQLKRAYAKLVRQFPPDRAPEAFQQLRVLYEAARGALASGDAPEPPRVSPAAEQPLDDAEWLTQRLTGVDPDALAGVVAEAVERAVDGGSARLVRSTFALVEATSPGEGWSLLSRLVARPERWPVVAELAAYLLDHYPGEIERPELVGIAAAIGAGTPAVVLVNARCAALVACDRGSEAWALLRRHEALIRAADPARWAHTYVWVAGAAAWSVTPAELEAELDRIDGPALPLELAQWSRLQALFAAALDAHAARADPDVPQVVLDSARIAWVGDRPTIATALLDLVDLPEAVLPVLETRYPSLLHAIDRLDQLMSHRESARMRRWDQPDGLPPPAALEPIANALGRSGLDWTAAAGAVLAGTEASMEGPLWTAGAWGIVGAGCLTMFLAARHPFLAVGGAMMVSYAVVVWRSRERAVAAAARHRAAARAEVFAAAGGTGVWLEELVLAGRDGARACADRFASEFRPCGRPAADAHLRRCISERRAQRAAREQA
ncbi:MAG: hypothetical protein ACI9K2_003274 [Myxococcota bacterium]